MWQQCGIVTPVFLEKGFGSVIGPAWAGVMAGPAQLMLSAVSKAVSAAGGA